VVLHRGAGFGCVGLTPVPRDETQGLGSTVALSVVKDTRFLEVPRGACSEADLGGGLRAKGGV